jgi:ATP-dependent exoDNAse (exonuclease V) alpha subunit
MDYENIKESLLKGENIFLTGPGGVGKSYYINKLKEDIDLKHLTITVTSTTGISSFNIKGQTIHSFSGIGVYREGEDEQSIVRKMKKFKIFEKTLDRVKNCDILVIDEVSMLGFRFLEMLNKILKLLRSNQKVLGGLQIIFTGDFLQLPPINDDFCFKSEVWKSLNLNIIYLTKMYRVNDEEYAKILERIRMAKHKEEDNIILYKRHIAYKNMINEESEESKNNEIKPTFLYSKKVDVYEKNMEELKKNSNELLIFEPRISNTQSIKSSILKKIKDDKLYLKIGAQVMLTVNLDTESGLVNGNRGVILDYNSELGITIKFLNGIYLITPYSYEYEYEYDDNDDNDDNDNKNTKKLKYTVEQYPLILAYSLSIHKVQGCTLDYAIIDIGYSVFESSMSYVALSRVRNLNGLFLKAYQPSKIFCDKDALSFYESLF